MKIVNRAALALLIASSLFAKFDLKELKWSDNFNSNCQKSTTEIKVVESIFNKYLASPFPNINQCSNKRGKNYSKRIKIRTLKTPIGTFRVRDKIILQRSTTIGAIYKNGKRIYSGKKADYRGSWSGVIFIGKPLKKSTQIANEGDKILINHKIANLILSYNH